MLDTCLIIGEHTRCSQGCLSCLLQGEGSCCLTIQTEEKCAELNYMDNILGLDCCESLLLPFELGHQWSSGQTQLSEPQLGCQSPQSHILRRQAAHLKQYSIASTNNIIVGCPLP